MTRWHHVRDADDPEAWVRRVARHLAMDGCRQRPSGTTAPAQQDVIVRHYLLDMPVAEVARDLDNRPENTVKTQLARARVRLGELTPRRR